MSRSTRNSTSDYVVNPAKFKLEWKSGDGTFAYWNAEKEEEIVLGELEFVLLDRASSVSGWNDPTSSRIYSNYIVNCADQELTVKESKNNTIISKGLYKDIKCDKFHYVQNLFVLAKIEDEWQLCQINFKKSSLGAWTEFSSATGLKTIYGSIVKVAPSEPMKKGRVEYVLPVFTMEELTDDLSTEADEVDKNILQNFIQQFSNQKKAEQTADEDA